VQTCLRKIPIEDTPPILAGVRLYRSRVGSKKPKPPLRAKHGPVSGTAILDALAIFHALVYTWEWSVDQLAWSSTTSGGTRVALDGLVPGKLYWFRVRAFLRDRTTTDHVPAVSLMMI
jgi:hypothetical protein